MAFVSLHFSWYCPFVSLHLEGKCYLWSPLLSDGWARIYKEDGVLLWRALLWRVHRSPRMCGPVLTLPLGTVKSRTLPSIELLRVELFRVELFFIDSSPGLCLNLWYPQISCPPPLLLLLLNEISNIYFLQVSNIIGILCIIYMYKMNSMKIKFVGHKHRTLFLIL